MGAGPEFDADRHDNPHYRIVERDAHRELHNTAIVEKGAQRVESLVAHLDVGGAMVRGDQWNCG